MKSTFLTVFSIIILQTSLINAQDKDSFSTFSEKINKALNIGNTETIAKYFSASVDLSVLDKEGIYSSTQTQNILKDFFVKHKPAKFVMLHYSGKGDSRYYIGTLTTNTGDYRVFYVLKNSVKYPQITQFRIEKKTH